MKSDWLDRHQFHQPGNPLNFEFKCINCHVTDMPRRKYAMRLNLSLFLEENQI